MGNGYFFPVLQKKEEKNGRCASFFPCGQASKTNFRLTIRISWHENQPKTDSIEAPVHLSGSHFFEAILKEGQTISAIIRLLISFKLAYKSQTCESRFCVQKIEETLNC